MIKKVLTKKELEKLIGNDDESVKFVEKKITSNTSELWKYYHHVFVNDDQQEFVVCNTCKTLLVHTSANGTNNLRTHLKSCTKIDKSRVLHQRTVHDFYSSSKQSQIPKKIKLSITQACTEFCALDGRAFEVMKGDGFKNLSKALLDAGRYVNASSIEIKDLLPHPTTISRNITRIYEDSKTQLINICEQLPSFCIVVDLWTEHYTGINYCGVAVRYVNENFQLFTFILGCLPYNAPSHSAQHIREFVNKILQDYKLQLDATKYVVSDNEAKMACAFRDQCLRVGCADHYLNKQLQHAFESEQIYINKNKIEKVDCDLVQNLFGQIKKIVTSVRRAHQQQKLSRKLISYSETRFAGGIIMLDVFREVFFELPTALVNNKLMEDYNSIDKYLLDEICNFLGHFQEVIDILSEDQRPTLHQVIPLRQYLINRCEKKETDSIAIIQLKIFLERRMANAWIITDQHRLATILHPKLKNFMICLDEKEKSVNVLKLEFERRRLINSSSCTNSLTSTDVSLQTSSSTSTTTSTIGTTQKRKNLLSECFDTKVDVICKPPNPYQEIDDYLSSDLNESHYDDNNSDDIDILLFWKEKQHSFPTLSSIAKEIFAIPASNTVVERLFSAAKHVITEKRTSLDCEKINQLLFLQKNFKTLKQFISDTNRKRTISMSSTTTVSSEESTYTTPKQPRLAVEDDLSDFDDKEIFLD